MTRSPVLKVNGISKRFGGTIALSDVDLDLLPGDIHCLVGENGAGKSTLVKIITGIEHPDNGNIVIDEQRVVIDGVNTARKLGIGAVYQHPIVFPDLNVIENIFAGQQLLVNVKWLPVVDRRTMRLQVARVFNQMGVDIDPDTAMTSLSIGDRQLVEIAKALVENVRILILDEPTASLSAKEVESLFAIMRKLVDQGVAILFITHRLEEIFHIGDRVTVLRDGERVATCPLKEVTREQVIEMMVGRSLDIYHAENSARAGDEVLRVENWGRQGVFAGVSFSVRAGEILGLAGLVGAGRTEVTRTLFGLDSYDVGELWIRGKRIVPKSPAQMQAQGLVYISEDRYESGLILQWPIFKNISLPIIRSVSHRFNFLNLTAERQLAEQYVKQLMIRPPDIQKLVQYLSGGNQQKVLIAKGLATSPTVLILDEPTVGVDIGAKTEVHRLITKLAEDGVAIILISSDLPEILALCNRILVFCEGRIVGAFSSDDASQETIMRAATDYQASINYHSGHKLHGTASIYG